MSIDPKTVEQLALNAGLDRSALPYFMGQVDVETGHFRWMTELGDEDYFSRYDGRSDLGNSEEGDGYNYRGRGLIMLTGRANYAYFGQVLGLDLIENPDQASELDVAVKIAVAYWNERVSAEDVAGGDVDAITYSVNGGYNGLKERQAATEKYLAALS